jgi:anti-anti-sigma regulatory factor
MGNVAVEQQNDTCIVRLTGDLKLDSIVELHTALQDALQEAMPVSVVLDDLGSFDLPLIQLLYSAYRTAATKQRDFTVDPGDSRDRIIRMREFAGLPPLGFEQEQ